MRSPGAWVQCLRATRGIERSVGLDIAVRRRAEEIYRIQLGTDPVGITVDAHEVPVDGGTITVYVYRPSVSDVLPAHVYLHAGGYWSGRAAQLDGLSRELVAGVGCAVINVEYRLAPEHRFPVAPHDCFAALQWTIAHADELGID